jgi:hypothetical protein
MLRSLRRLVAAAGARGDLVERPIATAMGHELVDHDPRARLLARGEARGEGGRHTARRGELPAALD